MSTVGDVGYVLAVFEVHGLGNVDTALSAHCVGGFTFAFDSDLQQLCGVNMIKYSKQKIPNLRDGESLLLVIVPVVVVHQTSLLQLLLHLDFGLVLVLLGLQVQLDQVEHGLFDVLRP